MYMYVAKIWVLFSLLAAKYGDSDLRLFLAQFKNKIFHCMANVFPCVAL